MFKKLGLVGLVKKVSDLVTLSGRDESKVFTSLFYDSC